jgi:cytidine deaminase
MSESAKMLVDAARAATMNAHAPYSGFGVGAALLLADGQIITGTNFENASYGLTLCAETVAIATANSLGKLRDIRAIAIIGGKLDNGTISGASAIYPCGRCRQVINEAAEMGGGEIPVHCASADGAILETHMSDDLLPFAFGPKDLGLT